MNLTFKLGVGSVAVDDDDSESAAWIASLGEMVVEAAASSVAKRHVNHDTLQKMIETQCRDAVYEQIKERTQAEVDKILSEGFTRTDGYGRAQGTVTLRDFVLEHLTKKGYNSTTETWVEAQIKSVLVSKLGKTFTAEVEAARKKIRAMLDAKTVEAVKAELSKLL